MHASMSNQLVRGGPGLRSHVKAENGRPLCEVRWLRHSRPSGAIGRLMATPMEDYGIGTPTRSFCREAIEKG